MVQLTNAGTAGEKSLPTGGLGMSRKLKEVQKSAKAKVVELMENYDVTYIDYTADEDRYSIGLQMKGKADSIGFKLPEEDDK
jgi:hypothetical protein